MLFIFYFIYFIHFSFTYLVYSDALQCGLGRQLSSLARRSTSSGVFSKHKMGGFVRILGDACFGYWVGQDFNVVGFIS